LGKTNREINVLEELLMLNPDASELIAPTLDGHFLYSVWRNREHHYLIVVHIGDQPESFTIDLTPIVGAAATRARLMFGAAAADLQNSRFRSSFGAYAARAYEIN
jgi:hypothetical protein